MTTTPRPLRQTALYALALLAALGGGCHLIFPFSSTAPEPDAGPTTDAMIDAPSADAALTDTALDQTPLDGGTDVRDLPTQDLLADQTSLKDSTQDAPSCTCAAADFDGDGDVDGTDLSKLQACYGKPAPLPKTCSAADTDGDGDVDAADLNCLGKWMGQFCP